MTPVQQANKAIVLTPAGGAAAIAVVRLTGPGVGDFLRSHFTKKPKLGGAVHGLLHDVAETVDDPVVVLVDEQVADLNLHGGPWVVRKTLELCEHAGFDVIDQTTLPLISEAIDGDTPLEREVLAHLPRATTELGVRLLLAQPDAWSGLKQRAVAGAPGIADQLAAILKDRTLDHLLIPPQRVAIVGAANVGKSTLANALFAQERSITADIAGTTRDWVGELANIEGLPVMLVDTPGLRETDDPIERLAIERSSGEVGKADLVILVLDASRPIEEQSPLLSRFNDAIVVINKSDVAPAWHAATFVVDGIHAVATRGTGIAELRQRILEHFQISTSTTEPRIWTARQRNLVERAVTDRTVLRHL